MEVPQKKVYKIPVVVKARLNLHEASELSRPQTWGLILVY